MFQEFYVFRTVTKWLYSICTSIHSKRAVSQSRHREARNGHVTNMVSSVLSSDTSDENSVYDLLRSTSNVPLSTLQ